MPNVPPRRRRMPAVAVLVSCLPAAASAAPIGPTNLPPGFCTVPQATDLVLAANRQFNTADGGDCTLTQAQSLGPELCIVRFRAITIGPGVTVTVTGPRLLVLTASTTFTLQGTVDVTGSGGTGSQGVGSAVSGAGGGGHGSAGGQGGASGDGNPGALGGNAIGNAALRPLTAGSRGGIGGSGNAGGAGGGAVQLVSCGSFLLDTNAQVRANGFGGGGGTGGPNGSDGFAGAGGGSGGGILIEADTVDIVGRAVANGGGGGGGGAGGGFMSDGNSGGPGQAGGTGTTPATGGNSASSGSGGGGGQGGDGGALTPPGGGVNGGNGTFGDGAGGGGGGGQGRIRVNSCTSLANTGIVSPTPSIGSSCDVLLANGFE